MLAQNLVGAGPALAPEELALIGSRVGGWIRASEAERAGGAGAGEFVAGRGGGEGCGGGLCAVRERGRVVPCGGGFGVDVGCGGGGAAGWGWWGGFAGGGGGGGGGVGGGVGGGGGLVGGPCGEVVVDGVEFVARHAGVALVAVVLGLGGVVGLRWCGAVRRR